MTTYDDQAQPLPGMEDLTAQATPMIWSLRRTIAALDQAGVLDETHALSLQAMHLLARSAEMKVASGRMSTVANDVDLLLRIQAGIVGEDGETGVDEQLRLAMEEFQRKLSEAGSG